MGKYKIQFVVEYHMCMQWSQWAVGIASKILTRIPNGILNDLISKKKEKKTPKGLIIHLCLGKTNDFS